MSYLLIVVLETDIAMSSTLPRRKEWRYYSTFI